MQDDEAYGISTTPTGGGPKTVTVFFTNGTSKDFANCTDISEPADSVERAVLIFTCDGKKHTFRKIALAGWAY